MFGETRGAQGLFTEEEQTHEHHAERFRAPLQHGSSPESGRSKGAERATSGPAWTRTRDLILIRDAL